MDDTLPMQHWQVSAASPKLLPKSPKSPRSVLSPRHRVKSERNYHVTFVEPPAPASAIVTTYSSPLHDRSVLTTKFIDDEEDPFEPVPVANGDVCQGQDDGIADDNLAAFLDDETDDVPVIPVRPAKARAPRPLSTLSYDNPFVAESELQQKADFILTHSTITCNRTTLKIVDPDLAPNYLPDDNDDGSASANNNDDVILKSHQAATLQSSLPHYSSCSDAGNGNAVKSAQTDADLAVTKVQVVKTAPPEPQRAEEVKLKGMGRCCVVV